MDSVEESSLETGTMPEGIGWKWTNEMHTSFLDRMEASFVRKVLFGGEVDEGQGTAIPLAFLVRTRCAPSPSPPPLDRYLPDSAESTLDLHGSSCKRRRSSSRRRTAAAARQDRRDILEHPTRKVTKSRKLSFQRSNESDDQDQVVLLFQSPTSSDSSQDEKV